MTCIRILLLIFLIKLSITQAPFIQLDTVHQAYSQFQVNLILNQNRNHPIIISTVSTNQSKNAANQILKGAHKIQPYSAFSIIIDCNQFVPNLNNTLGICSNFKKQDNKKKTEQQNNIDNYFTCHFFIPSQIKIKQKGHTIMKNHQQQPLPDAQHFTSQYIAQVIRKNIPDYVYYLEDQYQLVEFLQQSSNFKVAKQPKLLYFDQNLLAPIFLRKLSALMDGKIQVAVTDDPPISKTYNSAFDSLILLQYSFDTKKYQHRQIKFEQSNQPQKTIISDELISKYMKVKKNRDILLDFEHQNYTIYQFSSKHQIQYLQTHGRPIVIQISQNNEKFNCSKINKVAENYSVLFNYVCYNRSVSEALKKIGNNEGKQFLFITDTLTNGIWVNQSAHFLQLLPRNISRQRVSTQTQADYCLKTAKITQRDPIFYYFNQKTNNNNIHIMNYLNSLPQVTSLLYICQIYLPDEQLIKKFEVKINTIFTLTEQIKTGHLRKLQHSKISTFLQIKMFLRQIAIQKMIRVYQQRILNNKLQKIDTSEQLTDKCFNRKCIVALLATGKYREQEQMKILKQFKLKYQELFLFVWIDGICHWDVPRQLKLLKKKQKVIDRSYVFFYNEKDITYKLWESKKFWDKKQLQKWIKSLKNTRKINHLKFAIDIQDRICDKKSNTPKLPEEL